MTLVEVMVATALSSIAALGIFSLSYFNNAFQFRTEQRSAAILLAEEKMEESLRLPFGELLQSTTEVVTFNRAKLGGSNTQTAVVEINLYDESGFEIPNGPPADAYHFIKVEVVVTFIPRSEQSTTVRLVTWRVP